MVGHTPEDSQSVSLNASYHKDNNIFGLGMGSFRRLYNR